MNERNPTASASYEPSEHSDKYKTTYLIAFPTLHNRWLHVSVRNTLPYVFHAGLGRGLAPPVDLHLEALLDLLELLLSARVVPGSGTL